MRSTISQLIQGLDHSDPYIRRAVMNGIVELAKNSV
jgi:hypothetical protein